MWNTGTASRLDSTTAGAQPAKRRHPANFLIGHLMCTAQKATRVKVQFASHAMRASSPMVVPVRPVKSALYAAHPCCLRVVSETLLLGPFLDAPCPWMYLQAGEFAERTGEKCTQCPKGAYRGANLPGDRCYACAAGFFAAGDGSKQCTKCSKGHYQQDTGKSTCKECERGLYQDQRGRTACKDCPLGAYCIEPHNYTSCPSGTTTRKQRCGCKRLLNQHPCMHETGASLLMIASACKITLRHQGKLGQGHAIRARWVHIVLLTLIAALVAQLAQQ